MSLLLGLHATVCAEHPAQTQHPVGVPSRSWQPDRLHPMTPITGSVPVTLWVMKHLGRYSPIVLHLAFEDLCRQKRKRSAEGSVLVR